MSVLTKYKTNHTCRHRRGAHKQVQGTRAGRACISTTHALAVTGSLPRQTGLQTRKKSARYAHAGAEYAHTKGTCGRTQKGHAVYAEVSQALVMIGMPVP